MRPVPETGNELPPLLSGGITYPEEEKILCKKRERGTRITCSPGSNTELFTEMKGNKRFIFRLCAAAALFLNLFPLQAGECTLMSYNVKNGTGMDGRRDYDRTARVIAEEKPDVVALQELDQGTIRSGGRDTLQELAARTTLTGTYAKAIDYSGGSYGVGILSREKPLSVKRFLYPAGRRPVYC